MQKTKTIILILFLSFGFLGMANAWTEPTGLPDIFNVPTPLNTSNELQAKTGNLYFPMWVDNSSDKENKVDYSLFDYYVDPSGNSWLNRLYSHDIRSSVYYDLENTDYYIDPDGSKNGNSAIFGGKVGIGISKEENLQAELYVKGTIVADAFIYSSSSTANGLDDIQDGIKVGDTDICENGVIRYHNHDFEGCKKNNWVSLTTK
jgi:hypothetical protein